MQLTITINCDNAAFDGDNLYPELSGIIEAIAERVAEGDENFTIRDCNGNRVGYCTTSRD